MATQKALIKTRPVWYKDVAPERQGLWTAGDSKWALARETGYGERTRVILKTGAVLDGVLGEERNRWDNKHAIALRIAGRKTQKWIPVRDIGVVWGDKGKPLTELLTQFIETHRGY